MDGADEVLLAEHARTSDQIFENVAQTSNFINFTVLAVAAGAGLLATVPLGFTFVPLMLYAWVFRVASTDHETSKLKAYKASLENRLNVSLTCRPLTYEETIGARDRPSLATKLVAASTHGVGLIVKVVAIYIVSDTYGFIAGVAYVGLCLIAEGFLAWQLASRDRYREEWDRALELVQTPTSPRDGGSVATSIKVTAAWSLAMFALFMTPVVIEAREPEEGAELSHDVATFHPHMHRSRGQNGQATPWVEVTLPSDHLRELRDLADSGPFDISIQLEAEIDNGEPQRFEPLSVLDRGDLRWLVTAAPGAELRVSMTVLAAKGDIESRAMDTLVAKAP